MTDQYPPTLAERPELTSRTAETSTVACMKLQPSSARLADGGR